LFLNSEYNDVETGAMLMIGSLSAFWSREQSLTSGSYPPEVTNRLAQIPDRAAEISHIVGYLGHGKRFSEV
jgi:hypothetical protein